MLENQTPKVRLRAVQLIGELTDIDDRFRKTDGYRTQINYAYWKALANAEQETRTVGARKLIFDARAANEQAELDKAIDLYEQAFAQWEEIFDDYPILTIDDSAEDLYRSIRRYMTLIDSEDIPEDFPLKTFVEMMGYEGSVDPARYAQVRLDAEEKLRERKLELEAEEFRREQEIEEASKADIDKSDSEADEEAASKSSEADQDE